MLRCGVVSATATGRGQSASTLAIIATTSSSVGIGDTPLIVTAPSDPTGLAGVMLGVDSDMADTIGASGVGGLVVDRPCRTGRSDDHGASDGVVEGAAL